jgi:hypothetical protein
MKKHKVRMPCYEKIVLRRDRLIPRFSVTRDTFNVSLEDIIKTTTSSILSFLEEHYPERLSDVDDKTELRLISKVN